VTGPEIAVDRTSPVPLYFQVAEQFAAAIERGELAPGDRLDSEIQLADRLGLSRPTVRQAIQHLVNKGLIVRRRGVGTQVVRGQVRRTVELTSLYDDLVRGGQQPTTSVLELTTTPASGEIARALDLPVGAPVLHLRRLRFADGEPLALMQNWLPADVVALNIEAPAHTSTAPRATRSRSPSLSAERGRARGAESFTSAAIRRQYLVVRLS
jgi:DNA-binding GntR family transcriptional regulator